MSLIEMQLDDIADLPEFADFPVGAHLCTVTVKYEAPNIATDTKENAKVTLVAKSTVQLPEGSDAEPLKEGDTTTILYRDLSNEFAAGDFKGAILNPACSKLGTTSVREALEALANGLEFVVVIGKKKGKKLSDEGKPVYFTVIKNMIDPETVAS